MHGWSHKDLRFGGFWNKDVLRDIQGVVGAIEDAISTPPPPIKGEDWCSGVGERN